MARVYRRILLPRTLDRKLQRLAELEWETNGILLYSQEPVSDSQIDCSVEALYLTGIGTATHVQADPERMRTANEYFRRHPDVRSVKWHTHCRGTGEVWFDRLSQQDIDSYEAQLEHDGRFIGMMVSPTRKILYGRERITLETIPDPSGFIQHQRIIERELKQVARSLGYQTSSFYFLVPQFL